MRLPAGFLPGEVEFFATSDERSFIINGEKVDFDNASKTITSIFYKEYLEDLEKVPERKIILNQIAEGEEFTSWMLCNFGGYDSNPDLNLTTGKLSREFWDCGLKSTCLGYGVICHNKFNLTRTEFNIVKTYFDGLPDKIISDKLKISKNTLRNHNNSIMRKLKVHSKIEAIKIASEEGIII